MLRVILVVCLVGQYLSVLVTGRQYPRKCTGRTNSEPIMCSIIGYPPLTCKGGIIKHGGECGCRDVCAKVEGETCNTKAEQKALGREFDKVLCDAGLTCDRVEKVCVNYDV